MTSKVLTASLNTAHINKGEMGGIYIYIYIYIYIHRERERERESTQGGNANGWH